MYGQSHLQQRRTTSFNALQFVVLHFIFYLEHPVTWLPFVSLYSYRYTIYQMQPVIYWLLCRNHELVVAVQNYHQLSITVNTALQVLLLYD